MPRSRSLSRSEIDTLAATRPFVLHGRLLTLVWAPLPGLRHAKGACSVSKKVSLRAVDRNRIKRRVRDILRPFLDGAPSPVALLVRAKKDAFGADMTALRADIEPLLHRISGQLSAPPGTRYNART